MKAESRAAGASRRDGPSEEQVRDFIAANRDFFERHPDLLAGLRVRHGTPDAESLLDRQIGILRERNLELRQRLSALTAQARDNDRLYERTRALVLALLEAGSLEELGGAFDRAMAEEFEVEYASLIVFGDPAAGSAALRLETQESARAAVGALLKNRGATCGALRGEELGFLFPGAGGVGSAAVMPLTGDTELGIVAVGSGDTGRYSASMDTLFLEYVAEVLLRLLPRLSPGPR